MSGFFKPGVESGELGGQPSGDFAKVFTEFLQQLITGQPSQGTPDKVSTGPRGGTIPGTPAADPIDKTEGIMSTLQDLIGGGDITGQAESLQQIIQSDIERGSANLRERFTASGGGSSAGTPAAVAESLFRAEAVPRGALAVGQLESQNRDQMIRALLPILGLAGQFTGLGTPQASTFAFRTPSVAMQVADLARGGGSLAAGVSGGG